MVIVQSSKLTEEERRQLACESRRALYVAHALRRLDAARDGWKTTSEQLTRPPRGAVE